MKLAVAVGLTILALPLATEEAPSFDQLDILGARAALLDGRVDDAIAVLKPAAEAGDPRAQAFYGSIFDFGDTGEFDAEEALRWYRLAADQGYPQALYFIGNLYRFGTEGFEANPSKSIEWYERAGLRSRLRRAGRPADLRRRRPGGRSGGVGLPSARGGSGGYPVQRGAGTGLPGRTRRREG